MTNKMLKLMLKITFLANNILCVPCFKWKTKQKLNRIFVKQYEYSTRD